jgi:hypothetical protein
MTRAAGTAAVQGLEQPCSTCCPTYREIVHAIYNLRAFWQNDAVVWQNGAQADRIGGLCGADAPDFEMAWGVLLAVGHRP